MEESKNIKPTLYSKHRKLRTFWREAKCWIYLLPALAIVIVFLVYPMVKTGRMAFYTKYNYIRDIGMGFGIKAFKYVLTDGRFLQALSNTLIILLVGLPISMALAMIIALLINGRKKTYGFFQTIFFLPYVTSTIAIGVVFSALMHSEYGYINYFLNFFGVKGPSWLGDPKFSVWALIIFYIWSGLAFKVIILLVGLKRIDQQLYKSAKMDGAKSWRIFRKITLPALTPTFWMLCIVSVIYVFKIYNEVVALFGGSGPAERAITLTYYVYDMFYMRNQVNYAAAAAVLQFIMILTVTIYAIIS
mgnify:FL=1